MRDEDYDGRGFNPIRFGIIGSLIVAACVASLLLFRSYSENKATMQKEQVARQQEIEKLKTQNDALKKDAEELERDSNSTTLNLKKRLQQRESEISSLRRQNDLEGRSLQSKLSDLQQQKSKLETQLKKGSDDQAQRLKLLQDQVNKLQADLQKTRSEAARYQQSYNALQQKMQGLSEGDQSAADAMVEELAQARRELKREQAAREKAEQELEELRQTSPPQ